MEFVCQPTLRFPETTKRTREKQDLREKGKRLKNSKPSNIYHSSRSHNDDILTRFMRTYIIVTLESISVVSLLVVHNTTAHP